MSSLRNAVKRITHKERSQPVARQHLGILEKKKDYKVRAQEYHRKQDVLQNLRRKASARNPDEFYFGMHKSQVQEGVHRKLEEAEYKARLDEIGPDAVKLMKSQDLAYVRMQAQRDLKKMERMQTSLQYIGDNPITGVDDTNEEVGLKKRKHTIFLSDREQALNFNVSEHFDTVPELAGRSFNRIRKDTLLKMGNNEDGYYDNDDDQDHVPSEKELKKQQLLAKKQARIVSKARSQAYSELEARTKRLKALKNAESHLVTEKIVASKGRKRKVVGAVDGKPAIYKFRRKRAR
jgi:U3 small nucleolar RNA-associated protein 11